MYADWLKKYGDPTKRGTQKHIRQYVVLLGDSVSDPILKVSMWDSHAVKVLEAIHRANLASNWFPTRIDSYNVRLIAGSQHWSKHSWACAWDVFGSTGPQDPKTGLHRPPAPWARSMQASGFVWGGSWKKPDPHHFEVPDAWPAHVLG